MRRFQYDEVIVTLFLFLSVSEKYAFEMFLRVILTFLLTTPSLPLKLFSVIFACRDAS